MKPICIIKSHPKGISLIMDSECDFYTLVEEVCVLFAKSREFFGNGDMVLSLEGRQLTPEETLVIIEAVELNCDIKVPYLVEDSQLRDVRTIGLYDRFYFDKKNENAKIIMGNVESGEIVTSDTGLLITGDLKRNAKAIATGNIVVVGSLEGDARAGESDNDRAFILAGKLVAKQATIAGITGDVSVHYRGIKTKKKLSEPVVIRCIRGIFHAEPISDGLIMHNR